MACWSGHVKNLLILHRTLGTESVQTGAVHVAGHGALHVTS